MTAKLASKGWTGREELHQRLVDETIRALKNQSRYVFNALASLPDDRSDRQCRQFPNDSVVDVRDRNVNFFVLYANRILEQDANQTWEKLNENENSKDAVLDDVFAKAVKCGYEFVWYELGYTYFYAAHSSTNYKWEKKGGAYDAKCGQIFFFP
ncbi:hypothetical protein AAVH_11205 [Aphelenchoides avenae]|nr:hypothetical protein AAVH_11205 [Aphelenchus avenae]